MVKFNWIYVRIISTNIHAFFTIMFLVYLNVMQPFLLTSIYNLNVDKLGTVTGIIGLIDELWSLVTLLFFGVLSDKIGRPLVVLIGFVLIGIALLLFPYGEEIFPYVVLIRCIYASGGSAVASMLTSLIADLNDVIPFNISYLAASIGFFSGLGALFSVFVLVSLPESLCITNSYIVVSIIAFVSGIIISIGIKEKPFKIFESFFINENIKKNNNNNIITSISTNLQPIKNKSSSVSSNNSNISNESNINKTIYSHINDSFNNLKISFKLAYINPKIFIAYLSGFGARGGSILVTTFFSVWINAYYLENNLCFDEKFYNNDNNELNITYLISESSENIKQCSEILYNEDKFECRLGFTRTSIIGGVAQTCALIGSIIVGCIYASKRFKSDVINSIILSAFLGFIFYGVTIFIDNPDSSILLILSSFIGFAEISLIISSQLILVKEAPKENRGAVAGTFSFFGGLAIMFISYFGGLLFDIWMYQAPFFLMSIVCLILLICCIIVKIKIKN